MQNLKQCLEFSITGILTHVCLVRRFQEDFSSVSETVSNRADGTMLMLGRPHDSYFARAEGAIFLVGFGKFFLKCAVERHFLYPEHISVVFAKNNDTKIMILF